MVDDDYPDRGPQRVSSAYSDRAEALLDLGRPLEALPLLMKATAEDPDDAYHWCRLAGVQASVGELSVALNNMQTAMRLDPNDDYVHYQMSEVLHQANKFDLALHHAQTAVSIDPDDGANLARLATAEYQCGNAQPALHAAESAIKLYPESAALHSLMGDLVFDLEKPAKAEAHYRAALKLEPHNAVYHCDLGEMYEAMGWPFEASAQYLNAAKIDPSNEHNRDKLFNLLHHDLLDAPSFMTKKIVAEFDPVLLRFHESEMPRGAGRKKMRMTQVVSYWLLAMLLVFAVIQLVLGEPAAAIILVAVALLGLLAITKLAIFAQWLWRYFRWRRR